MPARNIRTDSRAIIAILSHDVDVLEAGELIGPCHPSNHVKRLVMATTPTNMDALVVFLVSHSFLLIINDLNSAPGLKFIVNLIEVTNGLSPKMLIAKKPSYS